MVKKPWPMCFAFYRDEDDDALSTIGSLIQICARVIFMRWFYFILFINYYMLNENKWLSWPRHAHVTTMTWVQVPGLAISHIIFHFKVPCSAHIRTHHAHSRGIIHVSQGTWSRVQLEGIPWGQVNRRAYDFKSQQIASKWARLFRLAPPDFKSTPPWLYLFFSFFLIFFIFYYFLCFIFWFN